MDVKGDWYFPWPMKIAGTVIFLLIASVKLIAWPILAAMMVLLSLVFLTARYGVRVDLANHTYKEYVWLLGWKKGKEVRFDGAEYLFVKPANVTRGYNSQVQRAAFTNVEYNGYLKISEREKVYLVSSPDRQEVIKRLTPLKNYLKTKLIDYSREMPEEIK